MFPLGAALRGRPTASVVDEHLTHRAGGDGEKVRAIAGVQRGAVRQLHVRLVDERRRVHRALPTLTPKLASGDRAQVVVDERDDAIHRVAIAAARCVEQPRHLAPRFYHIELHWFLASGLTKALVASQQPEQTSVQPKNVPWRASLGLAECLHSSRNPAALGLRERAASSRPTVQRQGRARDAR